MSDLKQAHNNYESNGGDVSCSNSINETIATVDEQCEINFSRDQSMANIEKQLKKLNNELSQVSLMRTDLAEWFNNLEKPDEQQEHESLSKNAIGKRVIKLPIETKGIAHNAPVSGTDGDDDSDVFSIKLVIDTIIARLEQAHEKTIADYEKKLSDRDQVVESLKAKLQALEATDAEKNEQVNQLRELITNKEMKISEMNICIRNFELKEEEVNNLRYLLKQADVKLEKRLEQMKQTDDEITNLIHEVKASEMKQTKDVNIVAENMKMVLSSLTDMREKMVHVHYSREIDKTALPVHLTRLQKLYQPMVEKLLARPVAALLFQNDKLTFTEHEKIIFSRTPSEAAEKLLERLLRNDNDVSSYNCFLTALETTSQGHLLLWLTHDDFNINSQHINLIRQKYTYLREQLNPQSTGLIAMLYEKHVIDRLEMGELESDIGAFRQAELLLTLLSRKSAEQFEQFLVALEFTEQKHVAQELRRCLWPVESPAVVDAKAANRNASPRSPPNVQFTRSTKIRQAELARVRPSDVNDRRTTILRPTVPSTMCSHNAEQVRRWPSDANNRGTTAVVTGTAARRGYESFILRSAPAGAKVAAEDTPTYADPDSRLFSTKPTRSDSAKSSSSTSSANTSGFYESMSPFARSSHGRLGVHSDQVDAEPARRWPSDANNRRTTAVVTDAAARRGYRSPVVLNLPRARAEAAPAAEDTSLYEGSGSRSRSTKPTLMHAISASDGHKGNVSGVTVHGDELYLVRQWSEGAVEIYSAASYTFERYIKVSRNLRIWSEGLTSCDSNKCLYVCNRYMDGWCIARVQMTGDNKVDEWKVKDDYAPRGLSVNSERNLIVACWRSHILIEYTTRGELVREIVLKDDILHPHHAIQLNSSQFLVSHGSGDDSLHRVCVVDADGRVVHSFGNKRGSETGKLLNWPAQLAVDRNGLILVADSMNNRIVVLDRALRWSCHLPKLEVNGKLEHPMCLFLDERHSRLFAGEWNGDDSAVVNVAL